MNIVQITPGAGGMYCGGCFRDNALVHALRHLGHEVLMVPLYLPLTLDEPDESRGTPTFFGGINVYLEQILPWFRKTPAWLHRLLDSPVLLKFAAKLGAKTRAEELGEITLSMVRGEDGNQARELEELIAWLKLRERPDVICLSNALLLGMARRLHRELGAPVVCLLSGEDTFLDALPPLHRDLTWDTLANRAAEVPAFIAPSRYFAALMERRLRLPPGRVRVIANGISLEGFQPADAPPDPPALGFFARMCREKGLDLLVEAYILIRQRGRVNNLRLRIGGGLGPSDQSFVQELRRRLDALGFGADIELHPNLDRAGKLAFLRSLTVFSTPALYGEAFGLYVIEALAAGVPVVQPRTAAFPELIEATGGGLISEPSAPALAEAIEQLLLDPARARALGDAGRGAVSEHFSSDRMARNFAGVFAEVATSNPTPLH
jgi:glycosyltransferase involved in cell wall biosynthesis